MKKIGLALVLFVLISFPVTSQKVKKDEAKDRDTPDVETVIEEVRSRTEPLSALTARKEIQMRFSSGNARANMRLTRLKILPARIVFKRNAFLKEETVSLKQVRGGIRTLETRVLTGTSEFTKLNVNSSRVNMCLATHTKLNKKENKGWNSMRMIQFHPFGMLSDLFVLNLYPRSFLTDVSEIKVERASTESGSVLKLIKTSSIDFGPATQPFNFTKVMFVDPESHRVTKYTFSQERFGIRSTLEVQKWKTVNGVKLPVLVKVTGESSGGSLLVRYRIQSENHLKTARKPAWASSSTIPEPDDQPLNELKKKTKQDETTPGTFIQYANSYLQEHRRAFLRPGNLDPAPLINALEKGLERHSESDLLMEYLGMVYSTTDSFEKLETIASKRQEDGPRPVSPYVGLLLSRYHHENGHSEKAKKWADSFRDHELYGIFSRRLSLAISLQDVNDPETFLNILGSYSEGDEVRNQLNILSAIAPPLFKRRDSSGLLSTRTVDFLRKLNSKTDQRSVKVLLTRAFTRKRRFEEANKLYRSLKDLTFLHPEINVYIKKAGDQSGKLMDELIDSIGDLEILHKYAIRSFRNENTQKGIETTKRITEILQRHNKKQRQINRVTRITHHAEVEKETVQKLIPLLEKENRDLLKTYLKHSVRAKGNLLENESIQSTVKRLFGSSEEALYSIARYLEEHERNNLLSEDKMRSLAEKKMENGEADRRDYMIYAEQLLEHRVEFGSIKRTDEIKKQQSYLEQGIQSYSDISLLHERLADLHFVSGNYEEALKKYRRVEKEREGRGHSLRSRTTTFIRMEEDSEKRYFYKSYPISIKVVLTHKQLDHPDKAVSYLNERAGDIKKVRRIRQIAKAYSLVDRDDLALEFLRAQFDSRYKDLHNFRLDHLTNTLIKFLKRQEQYLEALIVAELALSQGEDKQNMEDVQEKKKSLQGKIDQQKIRADYLSRSFQKPDEMKRKQIEELVEQLGTAKFEKRKRAFKKLQQIGQDAIPVLKDYRDHSNPEIQNRIRNLIFELAVQEKKAKIRKQYHSSKE